MRRNAKSRYDFAVVNEARYEVNKPDVVDESVDGEVLIVHLGTGIYYSSRGAGDAVWRMLAGGATVAETAAAFGEAPGTLDAIGRFASQCLEEGLLRSSQVSAAQPLDGIDVSRFAEPVLEKYTDMQELLLLDPIHDVEESGWPNAKPGLLDN